MNSAGPLPAWFPSHAVPSKSKTDSTEPDPAVGPDSSIPPVPVTGLKFPLPSKRVRTSRDTPVFGQKTAYMPESRLPWSVIAMLSMTTQSSKRLFNRTCLPTAFGQIAMNGANGASQAALSTHVQPRNVASHSALGSSGPPPRGSNHVVM